MRTPPFLERMHAVFASERSNQFLLSGNIHDLVDASSLDAGPRWRNLGDFLRQRLRSRGHRVIAYHIGYGIHFEEPAQERAVRRCWEAAGHRASAFDEGLRQALVDPALALHFLVECTRLPLDAPLSIVIDHADLLFPPAEANQLADADRRRLAIMRDWLCDSRFMAHNGVLILLAETPAAVNSRLTSLPTLMTIEIPLPDCDERRLFIDDEAIGTDEQFAPAEVAELSAGMTLLDLRSLFRESLWRRTPVSRATILGEVNRLLRARIGDHLDIIEPTHDLDAVLGNGALKEELLRQRALIRQGDPALCPVGILVAGPNGCGKTFTFTAWACACERVVVTLKNLRGSFFGETDRIFARVRQVLESLGQVIVLIDEADTQFAPPSQQSHDTEGRLFGHLIRMMGDPANRGRIVWVLMTARPERLAPDLKRAGRAGLHLPVFDPEGPDHDPFIRRLCDQAGLHHGDLTDGDHMQIQARCARLSAADYTEVGQITRAERALHGELHAEALIAVLEEYRPSRQDPARIEQMRQAAAHCSRASLLPAGLSPSPGTDDAP